MKKLLCLVALFLSGNASAMEVAKQEVTLKEAQRVALMQAIVVDEFDLNLVALYIESLYKEASFVRTFLYPGSCINAEHITAFYNPRAIKYIGSCVLDGDTESIAELSVKFHGIPLPQWPQRIVIDSPDGLSRRFKIVDPIAVDNVCSESSQADDARSW